MRVEGWLFLGCGVFFAGSDIVYWYVSKEPTGTTALALAVGLALLIGFFSPHSWWPFWLGLAGAVAFLGIAIGWWLFLIGMAAVLFASIGFVFEYYRGHFSH